MNLSYLPISVTEDPEAWELYKDTPYRWSFNKLEVALRQGLHSGPAATAPRTEGTYISRPVYNLYGMGIEAKRFYYQESMERGLVNYDVVAPGSFWCEWLEGEQLSVDYRRLSGSLNWVVSSVWRGEHFSSYNLTKFEKWTRIENTSAPSLMNLPIALDWLGDKSVAGFNLEFRAGYVTEIHLRLGNTSFEDLPVGTTVLPIWDDEELGTEEFREDDDPEMEKFKAFGRISNIRKGFRVVRDGLEYQKVL
jgi:hypothetical protein